MYFGELCVQRFGSDNVSFNDPIFEGWDVDVIIKIAVLWDGIWHHKQISKTQSLKQVQSRGVIKRKIIEKLNYRHCTIKDKGKFNQ